MATWKRCAVVGVVVTVSEKHPVLCEKCRKVKESGRTVYKGTLVEHLCDECFKEKYP